MSESDVPAATASSGGGASVGLLWIVVLLLATAMGLAGWHVWQFHTSLANLGAQQAEVTELRARLGQLDRDAAARDTASEKTQQALESAAAEQARLQRQITETGEALLRLGLTVEGGRDRVLLASIEQLLLLANDRLRLTRDVAAAREALTQADRRLDALDDPRLLVVREAIAKSRGELDDVPDVDRTGIALRLGQLTVRGERWPLRARVPTAFEPSGADAGPVAESDAPIDVLVRIWESVRTAVSSMFSLRRSDTPPVRLLAPGDESLVRDLLRLKLEGARLALLSGDTAAFSDLATASADWLETHFDSTQSGVQSALVELRAMAGLKLSPELPDISRSLVLLREHLSKRR